MRLCLFVLCPILLNISLGAFGSVVSVSYLESETGLARKSVRISMITGGSLFYSAELNIFLFFL